MSEERVIEDELIFNMSNLQQPLLATGEKKKITGSDLDQEEAATHNLAQLEQRESNLSNHSHHQQQKDEQMHHLLKGGGDDDKGKEKLTSQQPLKQQRPHAAKLKILLRQAMIQQQQEQRQQHQSNRRSSMISSGQRPSFRIKRGGSRGYRHRKNVSSVADLLDQIMDNNKNNNNFEGDVYHNEQEEKTAEDNNIYDSDRREPPKAIFHAAGIDAYSSSEDESETAILEGEEGEEEDGGDDILPVMLSQTAATTYGSIPSSGGSGSPPKSSTLSWTNKQKSKMQTWIKRHCIPRRCNISLLVKQCIQVFFRSYLFKLAIPLFLLALLVYYCLGNPKWNITFSSGATQDQQRRISIAYLINLVGRQVVTLELARLTQWIVLDCILLGSRLIAQVLGPFVTMIAFQAHGWPFIISIWACWDLFLLHGNNTDFQSHWFYWTGWKLYTIESSGEFLLSSNFYLRILLAMILTGIVTISKRMVLTGRFGKHMLSKFVSRR